MSRSIILLGAAAIAVTAAWTGGWFWAKGEVEARMDTVLADLAGRGTPLTCPQRTVSGWPFRIEIGCTAPTATLADGSRVAAERLVVATVIDDWRLAVATIGGPVTVEAADGTTARLTFASLRASVRHDGREPERISAAAEDLVASADAGGVVTTLAAKTGEVHLRRAEGADRLDLAASLSSAEATSAGLALLPVPADLSMVASLDEASRLSGRGPGELADWQAAGGTATLTDFALALGESRLTGSGAVRLDAGGRPEGDVRITARDIETRARLVASGKPVAAPLAALAGAFAIFGERTEDGGRAVTLTAAGGRVSANGLALGELDPLF